MTVIIDYGVGNLFSLKSSFAYIGNDAVISSDKSVIEKSSRILLPGVGAFEDAAKKLNASGLGDVIKEQAANGKPLLGICLGMQLLFEESREYGVHKGLGLINGSIERIDTPHKIPHMGWNALHIKEPKNELLKYVNEGDCVYFVHSFHAVGCEKSVTSVAEYGTTVTASVAKGNVYGTQFHPEKSSTVGLNILKAFCELGGNL